MKSTTPSAALTAASSHVAPLLRSMNRWRRAASALAFAALALAFAASPSRAQTVTLSFDDANLQPINDTFKVYLDYTLPAAYYQNLEIALPLPDRGLYPVTSFVSQSAPGTFAFSTTTSPDGRVQNLKWSAAALSSNEAVTGRITVTVRFDSYVQYFDAVAAPQRWRVYGTLSGTPFPFAATLTAGMSASEAGPFTPISSTSAATRTATGAPQLHWQYTGATFYGSYATTVAGLPGTVQRYDFRMFVCGNAGIVGSDFGDPASGGMTWTISRPPGSSGQFLRVWGGDNNGAYPESEVSSSPASPGFTLLSDLDGDSVQVRMDSALAPYGTNNCAYSLNLYVDVFSPCEASAGPTFAPLTVTTGAAYQPIWNGVGQAPTLAPHTLPEGGVAGWTLPACGTFPDVVKYWDGTAAPGTEVQWAAIFAPPIGATHLDNVLLLDRIPLGSSSARVSDAGYGVDFTTYFCAGGGSGFFDVATFLGYRDAGQCVASVSAPGGYRVPPTASHATLGAWTHIAYFAPRWGAVRDDALRALSYTVFTTVAPDYNSAVLGPYRNHIQLQGTHDGAAFGNALLQEPDAANPDPLEAAATRTIIDYACGGVSGAPDDAPSFRELSPGQCAIVRFRNIVDGGKQYPRNPVVDITIPDGLTVQHVNLTEPPPLDGVMALFGYGCVDGPAEVVEPQPSARPLRFRFGTAASPCRATNYSYFPYVEFCLDPTYPWIDGQTFTIKADYVGADNNGTYGDGTTQCPVSQMPRSYAFEFSAAVPPEMRFTLNPICVAGGGPAFLVRGSNSGGMDLSGVEARFQIPAGATFDHVSDLEAPAGAVVQVSGEDPPTSWHEVAGFAGVVRWVRVVDPNAPGIGIAARTGAPVSFVVHLTTGAASGTGLVATGRMTSDQLGAPASAEAQPYVVDSCHYVQVTKFWDEDADGLRGAGEVALAEWPFEVVAQNGAVIAQGTTPASGSLDFFLPAGTYTVRERNPVSVATWTATTPQGDPSTSQTAVISAQSGDVSLAFGNACGCPSDDLCQVGGCDYVGRGERGGLDTPTAAAFVCRFSPKCDATSACGTATCDPLTGACGETSTASCDPTAYYLPVRDKSGGPTRAIRCYVARSGQAPVCDTNPDGSLKLYDEFANACGGSAPPGDIGDVIKDPSQR